MKVLHIFLLLALSLTACSPSRSFVNIHETDARTAFNQKIDDKTHVISLRSGGVYKPTRTLFGEENVYITVNNRPMTIPLEEVKALRVTKRPAILKFASVPFLGAGLYNLLIRRTNAVDIPEALSSTFSGLIFIALSPIVYISGNNAETTVYYFDWGNE